MDGFIDVKIFSSSALGLLYNFGFALIFFKLKFGRIPNIGIFVYDFFRHHVIIGFWDVHTVVSGGGPKIGFSLIEILMVKVFRGIECKGCGLVDKAAVAKS